MTKAALSKETCLRWIRILAHGTWMFGIVWVAILGIAVWNYLEIQGVDLMPLSSAIKLYIPLGLLSLAPLVILAYLLIRSVKQSFVGTAGSLSRYFLAVVATSVTIQNPADFPRLIATSLGACVAAYVPITLMLVSMASYTGPGGFAEAVIMTLVMWPIMIGYLLLQTLIAAAIGGWVFSMLYTRLSKLKGTTE